jgi:hypothetical protein
VPAKLQECLVCGCRELFVRKDFSQRLGVTIVVIGLLLSTVAWGFHQRYLSYGILFGTALVDVVLYWLVPNLLQCYRCQAEYRGLAGLDEFESFDLETHERFRQQSLRMARSRGMGAAGSGRSHSPQMLPESTISQTGSGDVPTATPTD